MCFPRDKPIVVFYDGSRCRLNYPRHARMVHKTDLNYYYGECLNTLMKENIKLHVNSQVGAYTKLRNSPVTKLCSK